MRRLNKIITVLTIAGLMSVLPVTATAAEINKYGTGDNISNENSIDSDATLPYKYNSNEEGYCSSVKNQENASLCWAYASLSGVESLFLKNNLFKTDLDISHLDRWATPDSNNIGWQRSEGDTGYPQIAMGYLTSHNGPFDTSLSDNNINSIAYLGKDDTELIKKIIYNQGAVTANCNIINEGFSKNKHAYCLNKEIKTIQGHSLSVVGWNDRYSVNNFTGDYTPSKSGAWLCKNSYGADFNTIDGYIWISYEDFYLFNNDIFGPSYGLLGFKTLSSEDYLYQNEKYGATYEFDYLKNYKPVFFNMFDFSKHGNILNQVTFETTSLGSNYNIYYTPVENNKPVTDRNRWKKLACGTVEYNGYITTDINNIKVAQEKGAIAIELDSKNNNTIGSEEWLTDESTKDFVFKNLSAKSKSFVYFNDKLIDIKDFYKDYLEDDIGGTLVIKALTSGVFNTNMLGDTNYNAKLSISDATYIQSYLAKIVTNLDNGQLKNADFNKDGEININDVTCIQKYLVGL